VKAHHHLLSHPDGWGPKGAASTQEHAQELLLVDRIVIQAKMKQFLAACDIQFPRVAHQRQRLVSAEFDLASVRQLRLIDVVGCQELLRTVTRESSFAVIIPIDGSH